MTRLLSLLLLSFALTACGAAAGSSSPASLAAKRGPLVDLPSDQAAHPRTANEWWYVVGHLSAGRHTFGYEATAFRFSHVRLPGAAKGSPPSTLYRSDIAITDESGKRFHQQITYYFPQSAALSDSSLDVRVGSMHLTGTSPRRMTLAASLPNGSFALHLSSLKPAMDVGGRGYLNFGNGYTYYYSLTDIATTGTITVGGRSFKVRGTSWLDHQWGTWSWTSIRGWTWMAIQLDDGRQFSLFDFHSKRGAVRGVSVLEPDGTTSMLKRLTIVPISTWRSPHTLGLYPSGWVVRLPGARSVLRITPTVPDQELVDRSQSQGSYWEGSGRVSGTFHGRHVTGKSYTELTGFARSTP